MFHRSTFSLMNLIIKSQKLVLLKYLLNALGVELILKI